MKDFYYILGTDSNCTDAEIKDAYRKLSKKFHPDLHQGDKYFENRFREINEAYETLHNPAKRFQYDNNLKKSNSKDNFDRNTGQYYHRAPDSAAKPKTRGSGKAFMITLTLAGLIFGIYLVESLVGTTKPVTKKDISVKMAFLKVHKHHKQRPRLKTQVSIDSSTKNATSVEAIEPASPNAAKPSPVVTKKIENETSGYLYTAYVKANATHIINMRQSDRFDSDIIEKIPDNAQVFVLQKGDTYYRVSYNNYTGYIPKWSITGK